MVRRHRLRTRAFAVAIAILAIASTSVAAAPAVSWVPSRVVAVVAPAGITRLTITIAAGSALGNVTFQLSPSINALIDIVPSTLTNVPVGGVRTITLVYQPVFGSQPGPIKGTVQLRQSVGGAAVGAPLPVIILERAGSIAGTDTNRNGVWDYVDQHIVTKLPGDAPGQAAARQEAIALQNALVNADDLALSIQSAKQIISAAKCIYFRRPSDASKVLHGLETTIMNTDDRRRTYLLFSEQMAGQILMFGQISTFAASCLS